MTKANTPQVSAIGTPMISSAMTSIDGDDQTEDRGDAPVLPDALGEVEQRVGDVRSGPRIMPDPAFEPGPVEGQEEDHGQHQDQQRQAAGDRAQRGLGTPVKLDRLNDDTACLSVEVSIPYWANCARAWLYRSVNWPA